MEMTKYKLGDIAKTGSGGTPKSTVAEYYENGTIPWINSGELNHPFISSTENFITQAGYDNSSAKLFPPQTVLLAMYGATAGKASLLEIEACTNQAVCAIMPDEKVLSPLYLKYKLDTMYNYLVGISTGSARDNLSQEGIRSLELNIHSLAEQKKIAAVLSALDDKIALNKKMNQKLEAMAKRLYDYWFVQFDFPDENGRPYKTSGGPMTYNPTLKREMPTGWEVKKVSDYVDLITKGTTPSTLGFDFQDTGINFVKVECIENGQILQENLMHISEEANVAMKRSQLRSNDILVTIAGRLGSAAIVSDNILPANTNQAVALIRLKKEYGHLVNYIYRVISSSSMQKRLQGSNAQSIQKNLTLPILGDIEFVQDSNCEIIKRFNEITKPIFLRQQENIQEITRLTALRDKLLPLLMNGQVDA